MAAKKDKAPNLFEEPVGSARWVQAYNALNPQDQQNAAAFFDQPGAQQDVFDFGGSTDFSEPQDGGFGTATLDPMYQEMLQTGGGVNIPTLTSKGALEPYDLPQEAAMTNLMQDRWTSLADVMGAGVSGPGAIDPTLFAPKVTMPEDVIETPGFNLASKYSKTGGYQKYLTDKVMSGKSDAEAVADLWDLVNAPDDEAIDPKARALRDEVIRSLPRNPKAETGLVPPSGGTAVDQMLATSTGAKGAGGALQNYDLLRINTEAKDLFDKISQDEAAVAGGWQNPENQRWYTREPTQEDSYLTTKFHNLGLPTPIAQYDDPEYLKAALDQIPDLTDMGTYDQTVADTQKASDEALARARRVDAGDLDVQRAFTEMAGRNAANRTQLERAQQLGNLGDVFAEQSDIARGGAAPGATRTGPGINLGGRITGTSLGANMGRVALPGTTPMPEGRGEGAKVAGPGLGPLKPVPTWTFGSPEEGYQVADTRAGAMAKAPGDAILNLFDFGGKNAKKTQKLDQVTANQSSKARQKASKEFDKANTARYQATHGDASAADLQSLYAIWGAQNARATGATPFNDAIAQRKLAQRAMGLRV